MTPRPRRVLSFLVLAALALGSKLALAGDLDVQAALARMLQPEPDAPSKPLAPLLAGASQQTGLLRVVVGLSVAFALAILAAHPVVRRLERKLGLTVLLSSGLPFLALGVVFRLPSVGILSEDVVNDLRPALEFGVGWLGFVVGMQFAVRELDQMPDRTGSVIFAESSVPIVTTTVTCSVLLFALEFRENGAEIHTLRDAWSAFYAGTSLRDGLALGACAAQAAPVAAVAIARSVGSGAYRAQFPGGSDASGSAILPNPPALPSTVARIMDYVTRLDDVSGVFLLGLICAFYRPTDAYATWKLPHIAWLFVTLGMGGVLGILTYILVRSAKNGAEETAYLLGAIALSAGMSGYLGISPLVTCAIAGALLINLPYKRIERLKRTISQVERPLYLIFLLIAGALWDPRAWQGWLLAPIFVFARVGGKLVGAFYGKRVGPPELPDATTLGLALAPQSPIAIATIVSFATLYKPATGVGNVPYLMTACIVGSVLTELVVQFVVRLRGGLKFDDRPLSHPSMTNEYPGSTPSPPSASAHSSSPPPSEEVP